MKNEILFSKVQDSINKPPATGSLNAGRPQDSLKIKIDQAYITLYFTDEPNIEIATSIKKRLVGSYMDCINKAFTSVKNN